jgi:hypothetical protein
MHLLSGDLPEVDLLEVATRGQPVPPKPAEMATEASEPKPASLLALARRLWRSRASLNPKVEGSNPSRPIANCLQIGGFLGGEAMRKDVKSRSVVDLRQPAREGPKQHERIRAQVALPKS